MRKEPLWDRSGIHLKRVRTLTVIRQYRDSRLWALAKGHDAKVHHFYCVESDFLCIARIPNSNDNVLVGNSQLIYAVCLQSSKTTHCST